MAKQDAKEIDKLKKALEKQCERIEQLSARIEDLDAAIQSAKTPASTRHNIKKPN